MKPRAGVYYRYLYIKRCIKDERREEEEIRKGWGKIEERWGKIEEDEKEMGKIKTVYISLCKFM